jgi:hypothetical protein
MLIGADANVNNADKDGVTPVHLASQYGHAETLKLLIGAGANVNNADKDSVTPVHLASQHGHVASVEVLVAAGADVNTPNKDSIAPIQLASENGNTEMLKVLVAAGAVRSLALDVLRELTVEEIKKRYPGMTVTKKIDHLSKVDFEQVFEMNRSAFMTLPASNRSYLQFVREVWWTSTCTTTACIPSHLSATINLTC